jgi:hypothetical protein
MPGTALPASAPQRIQSKPAVNAYNILLGLENAIMADMGSAKEDRSEVKNLMYCRIVGHFFHHAPSDAGLQNIIQEVISAYGDRQKVLDIGKLFYQYTLCVREFVLSIGCCSSLSVLTKPSPICRGLDSFLTTISQSGRHDGERGSRNNLKLRDSKKQGETPFMSQHLALNVLKASIRDGFKCLVTGTYDLDSAKVFQELGQVVGANARGTECVHIFSESTNVNISEDSKKVSDLAYIGILHVIL